ncbi:MAG: hypothetical protein V4582_24970 [Pseudomonadota bacterium]
MKIFLFLLVGLFVLAWTTTAFFGEAAVRAHVLAQIEIPPGYREVNIDKRVQIALLGAVPPTLRFVYARIDNDTLYFHAVFSDDASEDHVECARVTLTEVAAGYPRGIRVVERIERDSMAQWKIDGGENLLYLRFGELSVD